MPILNKELERIEKENTADTDLLASMIDFFRTYADRCHHGKEEDILFRALEKRPLKPEHKKILDELIVEHGYAREAVGKLIKSRAEYLIGSKTAVDVIKAQIKKIIDLYPKHIEKEDKRFFIPVMAYFDPKELDAMLDEMYKFDMKLIHEKYGNIIQSMEKAAKLC